MLNKSELTRIFMPTLDEAIKRVGDNDLKLVHYTRFDVAKLIISGRSVWMRNARMMNDLGEIEYGIAATDAALASNTQLLDITLSGIHPGLPNALRRVWQHMRNNIVKEVFISCFSEHWPTEDGYGRLSMWRAYANPDGVALVLNVEPFRLETNALNAYSSPVFYGSPYEFSTRLTDVLTNVADNAGELKSSLPPDQLLSYLALSLLFGAVCLKHPGFAEEQEWRVIHMPNISQPSLLTRLNLPGPPQEQVFALKLEDHPEVGLVGLEPNSLIHKIIVGPSNRAAEIANELAQLLETQGVANAGSRIVQSGIPLRV